MIPARALAVLALLNAATAQSCCAAHSSPGCDDVAVSTECVCAFDPFCCSTLWDAQCVTEALTACSPACAVGGGDCDGLLRAGCHSQVASSKSVAKLTGGTLYVTKAADPSSWTHVVDLADAAIAHGCVPKHKPHMARPSPDGRFTVVTYTGDKFVHVLDSATKQVVMCIDGTAPAPLVVGGAMHDAAWHDDTTLLVCDMTGSVDGVGGGAIHKFRLHFEAGDYTYESSAAMGLTGRPTKPISLGNNPLGVFKDHYLVTDAKGGGVIINVTSMAIVKDFLPADTAPCVAGGLWVVPHPEDPAMVVAQYGTQDAGGTVTAECLFKVDLMNLVITQTILLPEGSDDAHGIQFCQDSTGDLFLINTNRASGTLDVLDYATGDPVLAGFALNPVGETRVLQPDVIYYTPSEGFGGSLFMAARGPMPMSVVMPQNFLPSATPGVFFLTLTECVEPTYGTERSLLTEMDRSIIKSDVHAIWGVNDEIWVLDQAATGSVQAYEVYSQCEALA